MDYKTLFLGISICIMFQLFIFGAINVINKRFQNRILGFLCFLFIILAIKIVFWVPIQNTFFYLLIGGPLELFLPPLLYGYLLSISEGKRMIIKKHLIFPIFIYILHHPLRLLLFNSNNSHYDMAPLYLGLTIILIVIYLFKGIKLFKYQLQIKLKERQRLRFQIFYISVNAYLLIKFLLLTPLVINNIYGDFELTNINSNVIFPVYLFLGRKIFLFLCLIYIYYSLTELSWAKKFFVNQSINKYPSYDSGKLGELINLFYTKKIHLIKDLNVNFLLQQNNVNRSGLNQFLKDNNYANFNEFINTMRLEEFKEKISTKEDLKFDLLSIAKESGFNSKASFYRVFKKTEGITPTEYLKNLKSNTHS